MNKYNHATREIVKEIADSQNFFTPKQGQSGKGNFESRVPLAGDDLPNLISNKISVTTLGTTIERVITELSNMDMTTATLTSAFVRRDRERERRCGHSLQRKSSLKCIFLRALRSGITAKLKCNYLYRLAAAA